MKLVVICNESQQQEFLATAIPEAVEVLFTKSLGEVPGNADALFDLLFDGSKERVDKLKLFFPKPVFINAVVPTLSEIGQPFIRINAWPGFLQRNITEMAALPLQQQSAQQVLESLARKYTMVPDWHGMVSARVIAMIVNEAYFTFGEGVSSREEIDLAMKMGTNYPYGPFEWGKRIGIQRIYDLLKALSRHDDRYQPAPALLAEVENKNN